MLKKEIVITKHAIQRFKERVTNELTNEEIVNFIEGEINKTVPKFYIHWDKRIIPCYILKYLSKDNCVIEGYAPLSLTLNEKGIVCDSVPTILPMDKIKIRYIVKRRK